jgi:hypothetical protein
MTPVARPAAGGNPDAIAIPMQSGSATKNTTTEAMKSLDNVEVDFTLDRDEFMQPFLWM